MKSAVKTYGFINAKLRARIGDIKNPQLQNDLLKSGSLVEAIGTLKEYGYDKAADIYDKTGDLQLVELSLLNDEIDDLMTMLKFLSGQPKVFVEKLLTKIEVENVKNAIRLWYSSAIYHRPISFRSAYIFKEKIVNDINYTAIINAVTFNDIKAAVKGSWYEEIFNEFSLEEIEKDGLFFLESALDKKLISLLYNASEKLKKADKKVALQLLNMEVDLTNIIILVRYGWFHQLEENRLQKLLYPHSKVYGDRATKVYINSDPKNRDIDSLLEGKYEDISNLLQAANLDSKKKTIDQVRVLERYLLNSKSKFFSRCLGGKPFTIATPLAYFFLRERQYRVICGILGGKYYNRDVTEIEGLIV